MLTVLAWLLSGLSLPAFPYTLIWFTTDGGGGTSSNAVYALTGTIGQPDTAILSGGAYQIQGGFWPAMFLPETGDIPTLTFQFIDGKLWIRWTPDIPGFRLEQANDLWLSDWTNAPSGNPVVIPLPATARFYRLCKP